ncbi:ABC transporter ATP-binding protein [Demequina sp. NBRC 110057]|uniref:ABC transporter ATP-binding protein n=1 Tax=Demequina sp. NBRC 110057 TaxID=1570346 RepID=UPI000A051F6B|nr:ABC transporter ATP-binding protein [Demequina sp. NBRC 110057]
MTATLMADAVELAYDERVISTDLTVGIPEHEFTVVIGPNACGKSTLLKALARLLPPRDGHVTLDGRDVKAFGSKEFARALALLPQSSQAPAGISVSDLVARGRFPHQRFLQQWSAADEAAIARAMTATGVDELALRPVDELSGGQRQRAWLAMVLAQDAPITVLDEPTTFLDIAHQIEVLDLCESLHAEGGRTIVAVLHDLNQAARYGTHIIAMKDGEVVAEGVPDEVITVDLVAEVFGVRARILVEPESGSPFVMPLGLVGRP